MTSLVRSRRLPAALPGSDCRLERAERPARLAVVREVHLGPCKIHGCKGKVNSQATRNSGFAQTELFFCDTLWSIQKPGSGPRSASASLQRTRMLRLDAPQTKASINIQTALGWGGFNLQSTARPAKATTITSAWCLGSAQNPCLFYQRLEVLTQIKFYSAELYISVLGLFIYSSNGTVCWFCSSLEMALVLQCVFIVRVIIHSHRAWTNFRTPFQTSVFGLRFLFCQRLEGMPSGGTRKCNSKFPPPPPFTPTLEISADLSIF